MQKSLLIVCNTPSKNTQAIADALVSGANHKDIENVSVIFKRPLEVSADDVLQADGILICTTENFGYMAGLIKDFFERIYYPCLEQTQGKPYALCIRAGLDGTGTQIAIDKIITGLRWKAIGPTLLLHGEFKPAFLDEANELGQRMSAGLDADIF